LYGHFRERKICFDRIYRINRIFSGDEMEHQEITEKIIKCAYNVYREIGFGFLESVYQKCMLFELVEEGLKADSQRPVKVYYKGRIVGDFLPDIIVEDKVIVELKSVINMALAHEVQLVNYLVATEIPVGLLVNFGNRGVQIKRKYRKFQGAVNPVDPVNPVQKRQ